MIEECACVRHLTIWYQYSQHGTEANLRKISEQLEDVHKENEKLRGKLENLGEDTVSSTHKATDDLCELPVRYGLAPFNLIDFPGINDAEDEKKQLFFTAIRNKVSEADLIIFVTDAMTAFSKASEIAEFRKIQELVQEENNTGHFVDLIVVVNKFDSVGDRDLQEIFKRIFEKLPGFGQDKVFRFSSHKMLVDYVLRCQLDMYLPLFNRTELQRILKTCNVQLTAPAQKRIKNNCYATPTSQSSEIWPMCCLSTMMMEMKMKMIGKKERQMKRQLRAGKIFYKPAHTTNSSSSYVISRRN